MRCAAFAGALGRELPKWVSDGVLTAEQAETIRGRYPGDERDRRRDAVVQALATIGAVVAGLGVILFFAANWDAVPRPLRVALLISALVGAYGGGYVLRHVRATRVHLGHALLLLGGILFGASIFLVGQMYHVQAHDPLAFLLWTAGAAPTAVVLRSRPLATLALLTFGGWIVYEAVVRGDAGFVLVALAFYGAALYAFGASAPARAMEELAQPARALGYLVASGAAFVFTFRSVADAVARADRPGGLLLAVAVALALLAVVGAGLLALRRGRGTAPYEAAAALAVVALVALAVLVPEASAGASGAFGDGVVIYPILFNLLVVTLALGAIVVGHANGELWLVNGGIGLVGVEVFARFVDVFWDFLPRSLAFIGAGLVLLLLALALERPRARLVAARSAR